MWLLVTLKTTQDPWVGQRREPSSQNAGIGGRLRRTFCKKILDHFQLAGLKL